MEYCDYCSIGDFYYSVTGAQMLGEYVAELSLVPDFFTSAGGISSTSAGFDILDGITDRATVAKSSDTWGAYTDADPLTAPQRPLLIFSEWLLTGTEASKRTYLSSTLDLYLQGQQTAGVTYTDEETGETVTVPRTYQITPEQETAIALPTPSDSDSGVVTIPVGGDIKDGTAYYDMNSAQSETDGYVLSGISKARSLGIESAIIDQWCVPTLYAVPTTGDATSKVTTLSGATGTLTSTLPTEYNSSVHNLRVLYGEYNKYGIMTTAGNSLECMPEEITTEASSTEGPGIRWLSDPRPDGRPYFRFTTINTNAEFWRNCIAGSNWQKVPLVYQGSSGNALTRLNFNNSRRTAELNATFQREQSEFQGLQNGMNLVNGIVGSVSGANTYGLQASARGISGIGAGVAGQAITGAVQAGIQYTMAEGMRDMQNSQYKREYAVTKANELSQLYQNTTVYTPTVNFPYNADIIRDVKGNSLLVYRYEYDEHDITRIDKLLTMYGYKETESLTLDNFRRRPKFDYVQCSTVTIGGLPRWFNAGIADQLRNGIRVWHVKPDTQVYSDGNEDTTA